MEGLYYKDTIFAPATPTGGAIAIVRISGADAHGVAARVFSSRGKGQVRYGTLFAPDGSVIDKCLSLFFESGHGYTGEPAAELQLHGGAGVMARALEALRAAGARDAEPGEFSKRAYLNGRLSLMEAEAVAGMIGAETARAARSAAREMSGEAERYISGLEARLTDTAAAIEALYEEDFPENFDTRELERIRAELAARIEAGRRAMRLRQGARVVIAGAPNAGKSSLMNALLGRGRAIVSPAAGTTRDIITEAASFCGIPVLLTDTAGLHASRDDIEAEGIARARAAIDGADLVLAAIDASAPPGDTGWIAALPRRLVVLCKGDAPPAAGLPEGLTVSAVTGEGVDALKAAVAETLAPDGADAAVMTGDRQLTALLAALAAVDSALAAPDDACRVIDIRSALAALAALTGRDADEAVIEAVFSKFCIGK